MITASIVIYNTPQAYLQKVVTCLANSTVKTIYVINNNSPDNLKEFAQSLSEKVVYIQGQGNVGYGAANNIAMREAIRQNAKYHLVLNPDIEFTDGVIEALQDYMDANLDVGQVMPKIVFPNGKIQYLCKLIPTPFDLIFKRFLPAKLNAKRAHKFQLQTA